jgi:hypothetical protein
MDPEIQTNPDNTVNMVRFQTNWEGWLNITNSGDTRIAVSFESALGRQVTVEPHFGKKINLNTYF